MLSHSSKNKPVQSAGLNFFSSSKKITVLSSPQPKLAIGAPGDIYEKEADDMADKVMRMPMPDPISFSYGKNIVNRKCSGCEEEEKLHRKESSSDSTSVAPSIVHDVINSASGKSLDAETRSYMEPRFNYDFSNVKIHDNDLAAKSAGSINALAYTSGNNVVFNSGQYDTNSVSGKRLLAHELTHVVQQNSALQTKTIQRTIGDGHDLNAVRFSGNVVLEAVYDDEQTLQIGSRGRAVRILQQALIDSGMSLPKFGVDGDFGSETETAVITFQRASGLSGRDRDGIVGPTTMGWLDQRFSALPTPAGTTPGATTGCAAFKTVSIDMISLDGSSRNPIIDLDFLNTVFNQACVKFTLGGGGSVDNPTTTSLLGGDTDLSASASCGAFNAEQNTMRIGANALFGLSSKIKIFYVQSMTPANNGLSFPPFCATGPAAPFVFHSYISNSANDRTLAHEIGHQLLNCECHAQPDADNLMIPNGPGSNLDATQEATIFANA